MSLESVELVLAIEEEFGIDIPNSDIEKMYLVGDVYEWLKVRIATTDPNEQEIWNRLVQVFVRQLNVLPSEVIPEASITKDLGCE
jgi:acyl carrier protein